MTITIRDITPAVSAYLTTSRDWGFVRYQLDELSPGTPGFDGPTVRRSIIEAVFVAAEDAELAALVLTASRVPSLRTVFDARGIPYRLPWGIRSTEVIHLRPDLDAHTNGESPGVEAGKPPLAWAFSGGPYRT